MSIGNNIKQLRLKYGLDQVQLGEIAGVTDKAVSSWENNISVPRMGAIEKMATYFGIKKSDIIEDAEIPTSISHYGGQNNNITDELIKLISNNNIPDDKLSLIKSIVESYIEK